jgi:hypothetical protein
LPAGMGYVGPAYDFGPGGAVFSPNITVTFGLDANITLAHLDTGGLRMGHWSGAAWEILDCRFDIVTNSVTTSVSGFSAYAVLVKRSSASEAASIPVPASTPSDGPTTANITSPAAALVVTEPYLSTTPGSAPNITGETNDMAQRPDIAVLSSDSVPVLRMSFFAEMIGAAACLIGLTTAMIYVGHRRSLRAARSNTVQR